jgi:hypothetical protein
MSGGKGLLVGLLAVAFLVEHAADREEQLLPAPGGLGQDRSKLREVRSFVSI